MNCSTGHRFLLSAIALGSLCLVSSVSTPAAETATVWIEAEDYATSNFADHWQLSSMGKPDLLSGGQWLMRGVNSEEVAKVVPGRRRDAPVRRAGRIARRVPVVGTRRVVQRPSRAPMAVGRWRLARRFPSDAPTTNLMELGFFCEVSWADLGTSSWTGIPGWRSATRNPPTARHGC
jgi:hypothetical protein